MRAPTCPKACSTVKTKTACVIGAGLGGLALAIRLQGAGVQTTVIEARKNAGGRAGFWRKSDFTFDAGPTMIGDPAPLHNLWSQSGHDLDDDLELMWVDPHFRLNWPDGTTFDLAADADNLRDEIRRISPQDVASYDAYDAYLRGLGTPARTGKSNRLSRLSALVRSAPDRAQNRAWQSLYTTTSRFFHSAKLAQAFSFHTMLNGVNPAGTNSAMSPQMTGGLTGKRSGLWWVRGGTNRLVAAMVRHFERLGGTLSLGDRVVKIDTEGNRATGIITKSGWRENFDCIASAADPVHSYRDLLGRHQHGWKMGKKLAKKPHGFGVFAVHFGLEGTWPGIPHHMALFGKRFTGLFGDICDAGVLPKDMLIYLHHPTITDPSMAPMGKSSFMAMIPVPHMGKLTVDWDLIGPALEKNIIDEVGRRLIPDIHDRITTSFHYSPKQLSRELGTYLGSISGAEPSFLDEISQIGHRDVTISNFYFASRSPHRTGGVSETIASTEHAAKYMVDDLARMQKPPKKPKTPAKSKKVTPRK